MSKVRIILLADNKSLGQAGDIVSVSEGYARNFLFPQGLAALATEQAEAAQAKQQAKQAKSAAADLAQVQQQASALDGTEIFITAKVKDDSQDLYAAIKTKEIAAALQDQANLSIKPSAISSVEPIASIGSYEVIVNLSKEVEAKINVTIQADV